MSSTLAERTRRVVHERRRPLAKAVVYRLLSLALTVLVAYVVLRDVAAALDLGLLVTGAKFVVYYLHERLWARVEWGAEG
jgi:uncharacterized membrane protein